MNVNKLYKRNYLGPGILICALLLAPFVSSPFIVSILIFIGLYSLVTTGLTMLMGYAGQISLGHAAFYGIGAYATAVLSGTYGMPSIVGILVGILLTVLVATLIGIPTLKLKENYLALGTLGFGIIIFTFFKEFKGITGGLNGFFGIPALELFGFTFDTELKFYFLVWVLAILSVFFSKNVIESRVGRALRSIHGSEVASSSIGVNIQSYKLKVFILSAVYASIAGSLYAHYITFINPAVFTSMESINFLIMVVIGGSVNIWGGMIGATVYVLLNEILKDVVPLIFPNVGGEFQIIFFGLLIVVMLIYLPSGLSSSFDKIGEKIKQRRRKRANRNGDAELKEIVGGGKS